MRFCGRFLYFLLLALLLRFDGTPGVSFAHSVRLATAWDVTIMQTSPYLIFAALCLYGIGLFDGIGTLHDFQKTEHYIVARCGEKRRCLVYVSILAGRALLLTLAKFSVDMIFYLAGRSLSIMETLQLVNLSFLYFLAVMCMGTVVAIFYSLRMKIAVVYFLLITALVAVLIMGAVSVAWDRIFSPVPNDFLELGVLIPIARALQTMALILIFAKILKKREFY